MKVKIGSAWFSPAALAELAAVSLVQRATLEAMRLGASFSRIKTPLDPQELMRRHIEHREREREEQRLDEAFERRED